MLRPQGAVPPPPTHAPRRQPGQRPVTRGTRHSPYRDWDWDWDQDRDWDWVHFPHAMTSLFRRSSSNGGSRGGSSAQELNNSRPARQVRRLEFNQAMEDFKTMFPNMDYDIIECVLRANNGAVDATIDQLLQMNLDGSGCDDSSDSDDSIPPEVPVAVRSPSAVFVPPAKLVPAQRQQTFESQFG